MDYRRTTRLEPGAVIAFRGSHWKVAGLTASHIHLLPYDNPLEQPAVWLLNSVFDDPGFAVVTDVDGVVPEPPTHLHSDLAIFDVLPSRVQQEVRRKTDIVLLARDGRLPGKDADPEIRGMTQTARVALLSTRYGVTERAIYTWMKRMQEAGMAGLVDRRYLDNATPWTAIDWRWREAFRRVLERQTKKSRISNDNLVALAVEEAERLFPEPGEGEEAPGPPPAVSHRQMLRYLQVLSAGFDLHLSKKTQKSKKDRSSNDGWRPVTATRAGHIVAVDSNEYDVFALDPLSGNWQQVHLLLAIDLYTRSILGWRFCGWKPNSQDVALLLRQTISPKFSDPSWPAEGRWRYAGVPEQVVAGLLDVDPLFAQDDASARTDSEVLPVAGVPVIVPDQLSLDNGKDYASYDVRNACDLLGVTLAFARPYTPTDKAHIERVFGTVGTDFLQKLPGYKGPDVFSRGDKSEVEDAAFYTLDELEERFAAYVAVVYQNAPHSGLQHPGLPKLMMTPNQMMDLSICHSGYVPVPIDRHIQIELLQTHWLTVSKSGITVNNLLYDIRGTSFLDNYRKKPSPFTDKGQKWRVKVDRRDLRRVYFFNYADPDNPDAAVGRWEAVPLRDIPDDIPFQERHLRHAKRLLKQAGGDVRDRLAVVKELRALLQRIGHYDSDELSREEKLLAAHEHAQRLASAARRDARRHGGVTVEQKEDTYFDGDGDSDAEPTVVPSTRTWQPVATSDDDVPVEEPAGFPIDDLEEWDPDQPDIA